MAKNTRGPKWRMNRTKYLMTLQRATIEGPDWKPRRIITLDIRAIPTDERNASIWFMGLLGRIWWDVTDTESAAQSRRDVDQMVVLAKQAREEWQAERQANFLHEACTHRYVEWGGTTGGTVQCKACGTTWEVA